MKKNKRSLASTLAPYLYLMPASLIMLALLGYPVAYNIVLSFFQWDLREKARPFIGLENYIQVISDEKFVKILLTTLIWTIAGVLLQMVFGIGLAIFVNSLKRLGGFLQSVLLLPWIIPGVVTALIWGWMLQSDLGIINNLIWTLGLVRDNILWLGDERLSLITVIFINTWKATPYWFLMILAGLQDLPKDQVESAKIDGAQIPTILRHVILPHLMPVIAATGVITSIWTLNYFDLIWVTTKGGPMDATSTLPIYTYRLAFEFFNFGQSSALAVVSLVIISLICIPYIKSMFSSLREEGVL